MRRALLITLGVLAIAIAGVVVHRTVGRDRPMPVSTAQLTNWGELAERIRAVDRLARARAIVKVHPQLLRSACAITRINPRRADAACVIPSLIAALSDMRIVRQEELHAEPGRSSYWSGPMGELAAGALVSYGGKAVPALLNVLSQGKDPARMNAIKALACIHDPRAVEALMRELDSEDAGYRERVSTILGRWRTPVAALKYAIRDHDPRVRRTAVAGFPDVADADTFLLGIAMSDADESVRTKAAQAILGMAYNRACYSYAGHAETNFVAWLDEPTAQYRAEAAKGLGELRSERAIAALILLLADKSALVRRSAEQALRSITRQGLGPSPAEWREWLRTRQATKR